MNILESIKIALYSIKTNKLRTFLTLLSISIGVFAITGAGALVKSIDATVSEQLESLGESVYYVQRMPMIGFGGGHWRKYSSRKSMTYKLFKNLKQYSNIPVDFAAYTTSSGITVKYENEKTDPNVILIGSSASYFSMLNQEVEIGRPYFEIEVDASSKVAVVGNDIVEKLFSKNKSPLGRTIRVGKHNFTIIGVTKPKGATMGQSQDNHVLIPITVFLRYYTPNSSDADLSYAIKAPSKNLLSQSMNETIGVLRSLRNCKPWEDNNFEIEDNSSLSTQFSDLTKYLTFFGIACGVVALIAAGVGIMNIMLVSVKERTREIGIRKAVGAKSKTILFQFIVEAVTLCQIGALAGIIIGILVGAGFGQIMGLNLGIPTNWIIFSILVCTILGVVSGAYPAWKAANLDPIEALRYE